MQLDELRDAVADGAIDSVVVGFTDHYGRTMGKRFDADFFLDSGVDDGTHACDYLLTVDMDMEPVEGYEYANWEKGYGDLHLVPDFATIRILSWLDRTAIIMCDVEDEASHEPIAVAPRSILNRQLERLADSGFTAMAASELEYFLFRTPYMEAAKDAYRSVEPAGWYIEDYHALGTEPGYCHHCHTGRCPVGVTTQDADLEARLAPEKGARLLQNYLTTMVLELQTLARACGKSHVLNLEPEDLVALTVEAAAMAQVPLAGTDWIPGTSY